MLRTADLLNPNRAFVTTLRRSGLPWAAVVSYRGGLVPPRTGPSPAGGSRLFIWTHSSGVRKNDVIRWFESFTLPSP